MSNIPPRSSPSQTCVVGWLGNGFFISGKTTFREFITTYPKAFPALRVDEVVWVVPAEGTIRNRSGHTWTYFLPDRDGDDVLLEQIVKEQKGIRPYEFKFK